MKCDKSHVIAGNRIAGCMSQAQNNYDFATNLEQYAVHPTSSSEMQFAQFKTKFFGFIGPARRFLGGGNEVGGPFVDGPEPLRTRTLLWRRVS